MSCSLESDVQLSEALASPPRHKSGHFTRSVAVWYQTVADDGQIDSETNGLVLKASNRDERVPHLVNMHIMSNERCQCFLRTSCGSVLSVNSHKNEKSPSFNSFDGFTFQHNMQFLIPGLCDFKKSIYTSQMRA